MALVFTPLAQQDLEAIGDCIAQYNPRRVWSSKEYCVNGQPVQSNGIRPSNIIEN